MEGPQFRQELSQQLKLCPQLMQNIALLQMNIQDLREFLERAVEENPMLEQQEPSGDAFRELSARNEWMRTSSDAPPEPGAEDRELTSRESFLRDQLARRKLPPKLLSLCTYLIELLDEDGFLPPEELEHLHHLGLPDPMLEEALAAVQALEPKFVRVPPDSASAQRAGNASAHRACLPSSRGPRPAAVQPAGTSASLLQGRSGKCGSSDRTDGPAPRTMGCSGF